MEEGLLKRVERLPGVSRAAPLLEQTATITGPDGRRVTSEIAGTDVSLAIMNGTARTLPLGAFSSGGIALSRTSAQALGIASASSSSEQVTVALRGSLQRLRVDAVLGAEAAGALADARVALIPLARLQRYAGLQGRLSRILIETEPGHEAQVRGELDSLAGGRLTVAPADADVALLRQALRPSDDASSFFAAISALLGCLFAFNAMLLTVPERRQAIADLRLVGTKRSAIVQIVVFQALCLGLLASIVGLLAGYALSRGAFHQSSGYLSEAFTIGGNTVVGLGSLLLSLCGGVLASFLASAVPLLDLRRGRAVDAVYFEAGAPGNALGRRVQVRLALAAAGLVALASALYALRASFAFIASGVLALATVLAVPLAFAIVLRVGNTLAGRFQRLSTLQVALTSLRAATMRSLALAATGAVAIFGSIALGGSREDLLRGIDGFAHSYAADADLWVSNPGDNQATLSFAADHYPARIRAVAGVASVSTFQGGFLEVGERRAWVIAREPGANRRVLSSQVIEGSAETAVRRLGEGGWITVSQQIAEEDHVKVGDRISLPTPPARSPSSSPRRRRTWRGVPVRSSSVPPTPAGSGLTAPTTLGVDLRAGAQPQGVRVRVAQALAGSGLEVTSAKRREVRIDTLTGKGSTDSARSPRCLSWLRSSRWLRRWLQASGSDARRWRACDSRGCAAHVCVECC